MENRFKKYLTYEKDNGKIVSVNPKAYKLADEAFLLFKELYDTHYGSINENDNLISIHTGGWSENEVLISEFMETSWWFKYHKITAKGGHYFFNTDIHNEKDWSIKIDGESPSIIDDLTTDEQHYITLFSILTKELVEERIITPNQNKHIEKYMLSKLKS